MAITEEGRHKLYQRLDEVLGKEVATVLMEHLPPVGWADVATKRDLDALEIRIDHRFVTVDQRFDALESRTDASESRLRAEIHKATVQLLFALVALAASVVGVINALGG